MHEQDAFLFRGEKTIYTREQKLHSIDPVNKEHISYRKLGFQFGLIDSGILRYWVNLYKTKVEAVFNLFKNTDGRRKVYQILNKVKSN
jgi:hypothetical protein